MSTQPSGHARPTIETSLYATTQDNGNIASSNAGYSWSYTVDSEGMGVQVGREASSNSEVTVGVWTQTLGDLFTDANFTNWRSVSNLDIGGREVSDLGHVFYLSSNHWLRLRNVAPDSVEVWISENNGLNWRKKAEIHMQGAAAAGFPIISGELLNPTVFILIWVILPDYRTIIGLVKITRLYNHMVDIRDIRHLIQLPSEGSLGQRGVMWDIHAVFEVDPRDENYILAPDIHTGVVCYSEAI